MEKKQQESQRKFSTYIRALEKEVKRKEEINIELNHVPVRIRQVSVKGIEFNEYLYLPMWKSLK